MPIIIFPVYSYKVLKAQKLSIFGFEDKKKENSPEKCRHKHRVSKTKTATPPRPVVGTTVLSRSEWIVGSRK
jgi:hypothetical protein